LWLLSVITGTASYDKFLRPRVASV